MGKRMIMLLLAAVLLAGAAGAEETAIPDGSWRVCGGTDSYDTLVFHGDGTMEAYDFVGDKLPGAEKGYLLFSGSYELAGSDLKLANGEVYHLSYEPVEDDLSIGNMGPEVPKGTRALFLYKDPEDESQIFGIYVPAAGPTVPLPEELPDRSLLDGKPVSLKDAAYEDGRLAWEGRQYSLQLTPVQIASDDLDEDDLDVWEQLDRILFVGEEGDEGYRCYVLTCDTLAAYPLEGGDALRFETQAE